MTKNNKNVNAQARKAAMVRFINENGGKANMNMNVAKIEAMHNATLEKNPSATTDKVVLGEQPVAPAPEQAPAVPTMALTEDQLTAAIMTAVQQATAPLIARIAELEATPAPTPAPVVEATPQAPAPAPVPVRDRTEARTMYYQAQAEWEAAREAWHQARKTQDIKAISEAKVVYDQKLAALSAVSKDLTVREHVAEAFYNAADATRTGGHKAVDAIASVMHKGVDMTANGIELVGRVIDSKPQVQAPAAPAPIVAPAQ